MKRILIRNAAVIATFDENDTVHRCADLLIEGNRIREVGGTIGEKADEVLDGCGMLVMPGLVNTHHHLYQTLTRNLPVVQDAELFPWLINLYEVWRELTPRAIYVSTLLGLGELALTGCTTTTDMYYVFPKGAPGDIFDEQIKAAREVGMRFIPCRGSMSRGKTQGGLPPDEVIQTPDEILRDCERLIDTYHDPSPFAMTRIALGPCSPFSVTPELLKETAALARRRGVRLHTHLAETKDEENYCREIYGKRPFAFMEEMGWTGPDVWFAHSIYVNDDEIARMGETGTGVAHCPTSNLILGSGIAPVPDMLARGVPVGLAVDGSASNDSSDMMGEVRQCLLVHKYRSGVNSMTARRALHLGIHGGAKVLGYHEIGALRPGMAADLIMINLEQMAYAGGLHDPVAAPVLAGASHIVDTTVINGEIVVRGGRHVRISESAIIKEANQISEDMVRRASARTGIEFLQTPAEGACACTK